MSAAELARLARRLQDDPASTVFAPLADLLRQNGRPEEAMAVLRDGFRHHPDHAAGQVVLARLHLDRGARGIAIDVLEEVVRNDPDNLLAGALLVELLLDEGRRRDARPILERLQSTAPADDRLAALRVRMQPLSRLDSLRGPDPFDCTWLAEWLYARGYVGRSTAVWRRLQEAFPSDPLLAERVSRAKEEEEVTTVEPDRLTPLPPLPGAARALRRWQKMWEAA